MLDASGITIFIVIINTGSGVIEVNKEFEITKISEYADGSMNNWVHHVQYILPQVSACRCHGHHSFLLLFSHLCPLGSLHMV